MLKIGFGSSSGYCDGVSRREFIQLGAAGFAQRRRQSDGKPALRRIVAPRLGSADPVGNDNQAAHRTALHGRESNPAHLISPTSE